MPPTPDQGSFSNLTFSDVGGQAAPSKRNEEELEKYTKEVNGMYLEALSISKSHDAKSDKEEKIGRRLKDLKFFLGYNYDTATRSIGRTFAEKLKNCFPV